MVWPLCSNSAMQCLDGFRFFSYKCWGSARHHRNHRPILRHRSKLIPAWKTIAYMALRMVFIPVQHGCHWKRSWWLKISETFKPLRVKQNQVSSLSNTFAFGFATASTPLALLRVEGGEQSNGDRQVGTFWGYWHLSQDWRSSGGLFVSLKCGCFFNSKAVFSEDIRGIREVMKSGVSPPTCRNKKVQKKFKNYHVYTQVKDTISYSFYCSTYLSLEGWFLNASGLDPDHRSPGQDTPWVRFRLDLGCVVLDPCTWVLNRSIGFSKLTWIILWSFLMFSKKYPWNIYIYESRWWFQLLKLLFIFTLGKWSNLTRRNRFPSDEAMHLQPMQP